VRIQPIARNNVSFSKVIYRDRNSEMDKLHLSFHNDGESQKWFEVLKEEFLNHPELKNATIDGKDIDLYLNLHDSRNRLFDLSPQINNFAPGGIDYHIEVRNLNKPKARQKFIKRTLSFIRGRFKETYRP